MLEFCGNAALIQRLEKAISAGTLAHCYIISGSEGSGRRTLARLLAAAMECTGPKPPCHDCNQCRKVLRDIHPDVTFVTSDKQSIGVETIRQMRTDAYIRPNEGKRRVFILPQAERLTESAQNAMLKILEEPPGTAAFFLLTDNPGSLLETVRSRAVELALSPVTEQEAEAWLKKTCPDKSSQAIKAAAAASGGLVGKALAALEEGESSSQALELATKALAAMKTGSALELATFFTGLEKLKRREMEDFLGQLLQMLTAQAIKDQKNSRKWVSAADEVKTAAKYASANVGTAHICGFLSVAIAEALKV